MPWPYTSFSKYTTQNERFGIYGVFKRKKQFINISKVWKYEICIPKSRILVQGILRWYHGENTAAIKSYIANQLKVDKEMEQLSIFDPRDPFTGSK